MFRTVIRSLVVAVALGGALPSAHAAVIASGETRSGDLVGGAGGNGREESWTFTGAANDRVVVTTALLAGSIQPEIYLYDGGGSPLAASVGSFSSHRLEHRLPADGTYTVTVRDYLLSADGSYTIAFANLSGPAASITDTDGGAIASNQSVAGTFQGAADTDVFQFSGEAGDRVVIAASGAGAQPELYLYPPGGGALEASHQGSLNPRRLDWRLAATGTYSLLLSDFGLNAEGSYSLSFVRIPGPGALPDGANAEPLASGETRTGLLSPAVKAGVYQFAGEAGERVLVTASALSGLVHPEIFLYPPEGEPLEQASLGGIAGHLLETALQATGTYTILVSDSGLNAEGAYSVSLAAIFGATTSPGDSDGGTIGSAESRVGYLANRSDTDIYEFTAQAGDLVLLATARVSGSIEPEVRLYAPTGAPEAQALGLKDSQWLEHRLTQSGTYSVVISDFALDEEGPYGLSLVILPGPVKSIGDADGGTILSGGTKPGVLSTQADTDVLQFYGAAGTRVVVTASSTTIEPHLRLYSPGGALEQTAQSAAKTAREEWQLLETGVYTLVISDGGLNAWGAYALSLVQVPGGICPSDDTSDNDGGMLAHAETRIGAFHIPGDQDVFHFSARPGDRITITAAPYASSAQPEIFLYPPGGGPLEASATGTVMPQRLTHTLLAKGLYTVVVSESGLNATGYYSVVISLSAASPTPSVANIFPPNGTAVVTTETKLMWDPVAGATGYDIYYGTDPLAPLDPLGSVSTNSRVFPERATGKAYYWRVVAQTPSGPVPGPFAWFTFLARPVIHRDDFTDGSDSGDPDWLPYRVSSWHVNAAKQLHSTTNVDNRLISNSFSSFLTGSIQTKVMLGGTGSAENASLLFAYQGDHQRYRYVRLAPGKILIGQAGILGGDAGGVKRTIPVPAVGKKWYTLRADLDSAGNASVYLDGKLKGSFKFKKAVAGWIGFAAFRVESFFDNFYCKEATVFP